MVGGGEQVALAPVGAGGQGGEQDRRRLEVRVLREEQHGVPLEDLDDALQGAADAPGGDVRDVDVLRAGGLVELELQLGGALAEPGAVAQGVAVLPGAELAVGKQDAGGRQLDVGDGGQDVKVEPEVGVAEGPAAAPRLATGRTVGLAGEGLPPAVGAELVTDTFLELGLAGALLEQGKQADEVDVVLPVGGGGSDDGPEQERALRVDSPLDAALGQPGTDLFVSFDGDLLEVGGDVEGVDRAVEQHRQHRLERVHDQMSFRGCSGV